MNLTFILLRICYGFKSAFHPIREYYDFSTHCQFELLKAFLLCIPFHCKELDKYFFPFATHQIKYFPPIFFVKHIFFDHSLAEILKTLFTSKYCFLFFMVYCKHDIVRFLTGCRIKLMNYCHCSLLCKVNNWQESLS